MATATLMRRAGKDSFTAAWFENDGQGNFTTHHIHEDQASYDVQLVDMDGDGDLDILNAGQESRNVVWFENRLKSATTDAPADKSLFDYDRTLPFELEKEPLSPRNDAIVRALLSSPSRGAEPIASWLSPGLKPGSRASGLRSFSSTAADRVCPTTSPKRFCWQKPALYH